MLLLTDGSRLALTNEKSVGKADTFLKKRSVGKAGKAFCLNEVLLAAPLWRIAVARHQPLILCRIELECQEPTEPHKLGHINRLPGRMQFRFVRRLLKSYI